MSSLMYGIGCFAFGRVCSEHNASNGKVDRALQKRGKAGLLTDAQILELRALSEFASWDRARLAERFGVDLAAVKRVLAGITRSRLVASREHLPSDLVTP